MDHRAHRKPPLIIFWSKKCDKTGNSLIVILPCSTVFNFYIPPIHFQYSWEALLLLQILFVHQSLCVCLTIRVFCTLQGDISDSMTCVKCAKERLLKPIRRSFCDPLEGGQNKIIIIFFCIEKREELYKLRGID